jgi:hypothetical protein
VGSGINTKQTLLDFALEAEKAACNAITPETREEWLKTAQTYRNLAAKLPN